MGDHVPIEAVDVEEDGLGLVLEPGFLLVVDQRHPGVLPSRRTYSPLHRVNILHLHEEVNLVFYCSFPFYS